MIPRPKNSDTMADVLKMQEDYLREKNEGKSKPAASMKRIEKNDGGKGDYLFVSCKFRIILMS